MITHNEIRNTKEFSSIKREADYIEVNKGLASKHIRNHDMYKTNKYTIKHK